MNRLYAVEGVFSLTGAMADHRLRLERRQIGPFLAALAAALPARGRSRSRREPASRVSIRAGSTPLPRTFCEPRQGIDRGGERQPAAVHAAVCALNTSLGNTARRSATTRRRTRRFRA